MGISAGNLIQKYSAKQKGGGFNKSKGMTVLRCVFFYKAHGWVYLSTFLVLDWSVGWIIACPVLTFTLSLCFSQIILSFLWGRKEGRINSRVCDNIVE